MLSCDKPVADVGWDPRWEWVGKFVVFLFVRNPFHRTKISEVARNLCFFRVREIEPGCWHNMVNVPSSWNAPRHAGLKLRFEMSDQLSGRATDVVASSTKFLLALLSQTSIHRAAKPIHKVDAEVFFPAAAKIRGDFGSALRAAVSFRNFFPMPIIPSQRVGSDSFSTILQGDRFAAPLSVWPVNGIFRQAYQVQLRVCLTYH